MIHCPKPGERVRIVVGNKPEYLVPFHGRVGSVVRKVKNEVLGEAVVLEVRVPGVGSDALHPLTEVLVPLKNACYEQLQSGPPRAECV